MLRVGHLGLTGGVASAASAIWIRKRILSSIEGSSDRLSLRGRIRQRGKFVLAGMAFTGCATAVSGGLDTIENTLGFGHRTTLHSVPWVGSLYVTAQKAKDSGFDVARRLCEKAGVPEFADQVLDALEDLTSWVLNGGLAGAITHWVGDLPTSGHGGTALQLLAPLLETKTNLDIILSADPLFNQGALYLGGILAAVSWFVVGTYLVLPKQTINRMETRVSHIVTWVTDKIPTQKRLYERAQNLYERALAWIRKISSLVSTPGPANLPLISSTESDVASNIELQSNNTSVWSKSTPLQAEDTASPRAGTLSLRPELQRSQNTTETLHSQWKSLSTHESKLR